MNLSERVDSLQKTVEEAAARVKRLLAEHKATREALQQLYEACNSVLWEDCSSNLRRALEKAETVLKGGSKQDVN